MFSEPEAQPMNESDLIKKIAVRLDRLIARDVDLAVHTLIRTMANALRRVSA